MIIISPHAPSYYDYMQLSSGKSGKGSMAQFGNYEEQFEIQYDTQMVDEISRLADEAGIPAGTLGQQDGTLDHGTMVPLYFLKDLPENTKFIRIGVAGIDNRMHYMLGQLIARAAKDLGRKVAIVASGDLSHCQKAGTHYGYKECGPAYDKKSWISCPEPLLTSFCRSVNRKLRMQWFVDRNLSVLWLELWMA